MLLLIKINPCCISLDSGRYPKTCSWRGRKK